MRYLAVAAMLLLLSSSIAQACEPPPFAARPAPPKEMDSKTDYWALPDRWDASTFDNDGTMWFWYDRTVWHVSSRRVLARFQVSLSSACGSYVSADHEGGVWLAVGDPIEHVDALGKLTTYRIPGTIRSLSNAGETLFVSDSQFHRIVELDPNGSMLWRDLQNGAVASNIAIDSQGTVYYSDAGNGFIGALTSDGRSFEVRQGARERPAHFTVSQDGINAWFVQDQSWSNGPRIADLGWARFGAVRMTFPIFPAQETISIAVSGSGKVYVLERDGIVGIFDPRSSRFEEYTIVPRLNATSLKTSSRGDVYAIGYGANPVAKISP